MNRMVQYIEGPLI